jgi:hypothetical protein
MAVTAHFLIGSIVTANLPALYRRFGIPTVTKAGALSLAVGVFGWAMAATPWQLFGATLLSGAGWVTMGVAAVNAIVSPWFVRDRPAALAVAYNGANVGGIIFSPLWAAAIGAPGFPVAAAAIGVVMVLMVWALADLVFSCTLDANDPTTDRAMMSGAPPGPVGAMMRAGVRQTRSTPRSTTSSISFFFATSRPSRASSNRRFLGCTEAEYCCRQNSN